MRTPTPPISEWFVAEVERRCKALHIRPEAIVSQANVTESMWEAWVDGRNKPNASTIDRVLAELSKLEQSR